MSPAVLHLAAGIVIEDSLSGATSGSRSTSHVITLPLFSAGDLVVIYWRSDNSSNTVTGPTDWTLLLSRDDRGNSRVWHKVMDGTEDGSVTVTTSNNRSSCWVAYALSGVATAEASYVEGVGFDGDLDIGILSPSWGSAETLWVALASLFRLDDTLTMPTNYGSQLDAVTPDFGDDFDARVASAHRLHAAASEDPDAWAQTGTTSTNPHSALVAVRPA